MWIQGFILQATDIQIITMNCNSLQVFVDGSGVDGLEQKAWIISRSEAIKKSFLFEAIAELKIFERNELKISLLF